MTYTPLPIGIEDFKEIIEKGYYYVDKTWFMKELLDKKGKVNLFTRPRRFGKTLSLSMLKHFFELPINGVSNKHLFEGLKIMGAGEKYAREQEQYPIISLTLKSAKQPNWELSYKKITETIAKEYDRHANALDSEHLSESKKKLFRLIKNREATYGDYATSIAFLSECLEQCYGRKVIILIDEYDVPLENAYYRGYYEQMIDFIRSLFESALKTNPCLEFAVITGCLRISKESIFTGLNNLKIVSILNPNYGEYFGFTEEEVRELLSYYQLEDKIETVQQWYDGYLFGKTEVYNPWSVMNYMDEIVSDPDALPIAAWSNTSSNSIVKDLVYNASKNVREEIEDLMNGSAISKKVLEDITYEDIHKSEDNLWNFLLFTGYLKVTGMHMEGVNRYVTMAIPNNEILYIYENTISNWFHDGIKAQNLSVLHSSVVEGNAEVFEQELIQQLGKTISYMDTPEAFYHGFLLGVLGNTEDYIMKSNRESGNGRYDIMIYDNNNLKKAPVLIELKVSKRFKEMKQRAEEALLQIEEKQYFADLEEMGYTEVLCYGISFFRKQACVVVNRRQL